MPFLSGNTKKVSVYGRKAEVRIVNRHNDFSSLGNDENDPFGFFPSHNKPKTTYGRPRASVLPSTPPTDTLETCDKDADESMNSRSASDESAVYATADSSASFHSATSSTSGQPFVSKTSFTNNQKSVLTSKTLNTTASKPTKARRSPVKRAAISSRSRLLEDAVSATPKAQRRGSKLLDVASPQTVRKAPKAKSTPAMSTTPAALPLESTPPQRLLVGRAPRRAAQAARLAIEDYDFTDRDMTPRRPVPTKSYFTEKACQLAELAREQKQDNMEKQSRTRDHKASNASSSRNTSRKSMAPRPRHTSALTTSMPRVVSISDSSVTSIISVSNSSFDAGGTSQSSFSLAGPSSDESFEPVRRRSAAAAKAKQNKRVTRRIVATSDDEEDEAGNSDEGSDDDVEQDPTVKLAAQIADLTVAGAEEAEAADSHLSQLLASISQTKPESFSDVIKRLRSTTKATEPRLRLEKIGEASYSEVFKIFVSTKTSSSAKVAGQKALVLKIIPIANSTSPNGDEGDDVPFCSPATDVEREIRLMQLIGHAQSGPDAFVSLCSAHVVKGAYPAALLQAWDRWDAKRRAKTGEGAENIRPDVLGNRRAYALLVMTDGGVDLESLKVKSWLQAASIFWQVVAGLSEMESRFQFEHRDLHWGNILVQTVLRDTSSDNGGASRRSSSARWDKPDDVPGSWLLDSSASGVKATIIDFTLSRAVFCNTAKGRGKKSEVLFYPFDDESLFEGSGDPQFEVYREMKLVTKGNWQTFTPSTNLLWLRYLAHKLIDVKCKACKIPKQAVKGDLEAQTELQAYTLLQSAAQSLDHAVEMLLETGTSKTAASGRKSLHPKARQSVLPPVAGSARKRRTTTAVTPLLHERMEDDQAVMGSVAQLMTLLHQ